MLKDWQKKQPKTEIKNINKIIVWFQEIKLHNKSCGEITQVNIFRALFSCLGVRRLPIYVELWRRLALRARIWHGRGEEFLE